MLVSPSAASHLAGDRRRARSAPARVVKYQYANLTGGTSSELDDASAILSYEEYFPYGVYIVQAVANQTDVPPQIRFAGKGARRGGGFLLRWGTYYASLAGSEWFPNLDTRAGRMAQINCMPAIRSRLSIDRYSRSDLRFIYSSLRTILAVGRIVVGPGIVAARTRCNSRDILITWHDRPKHRFSNPAGAHAVPKPVPPPAPTKAPRFRLRTTPGGACSRADGPWSRGGRTAAADDGATPARPIARPIPVPILARYRFRSRQPQTGSGRGPPKGHAAGRKTEPRSGTQPRQGPREADSLTR